MSFRNELFRSRLFLGLVLLLAFTGACSSSSTDTDKPSTDGAMNEDMGHEDMGHEEGADVIRVPNNGATISLIAPADGATFQAGEEVMVEIEVENITVGEDGNHWHIYVDGSSWGMVMGRNTDEVLRGLEPGAHEIAVYLSIETHEELEDGDSVMITVEE